MNIMRCRSDRIFFRVFFSFLSVVLFYCGRCPSFSSVGGAPYGVGLWRYRCALQCLRHGVAPSVQNPNAYGFRTPTRGGCYPSPCYIILSSCLRHCRGYSVYQYTQTAYAVQYCTDVLTENLQIPCDLFAATLQSVNCTRTPLGTKTVPHCV